MRVFAKLSRGGYLKVRFLCSDSYKIRGFIIIVLRKYYDFNAKRGIKMMSFHAFYASFLCPIFILNSLYFPTVGGFGFSTVTFFFTVIFITVFLAVPVFNEHFTTAGTDAYADSATVIERIIARKRYILR